MSAQLLKTMSFQMNSNSIACFSTCKTHRSHTKFGGRTILWCSSLWSHYWAQLIGVEHNFSSKSRLWILCKTITQSWSNPSACMPWSKIDAIRWCSVSCHGQPTAISQIRHFLSLPFLSHSPTANGCMTTWLTLCLQSWQMALEDQVEHKEHVQLNWVC